MKNYPTCIKICQAPKVYHHFFFIQDPEHDTKLLGVDGTPSALVGIYLGEGSL